MAFTAQRTTGCPRPRRRRFTPGSAVLQSGLSASSRSCRRLSLLGRTQLHAGATGFGQSDGNRLFRRSRSMFAFANMVHFLAHEFACLCRRRFTLPLVLRGPFECFFFRHFFASFRGSHTYSNDISGCRFYSRPRGRRPASGLFLRTKTGHGSRLVRVLRNAQPSTTKDSK